MQPLLPHYIGTVSRVDAAGGIYADVPGLGHSGAGPLEYVGTVAPTVGQRVLLAVGGTTVPSPDVLIIIGALTPIPAADA